MGGDGGSGGGAGGSVCGAGGFGGGSGALSNQTFGGGGGAGIGRAIFSMGSLVAINSTFVGNSAIGGAAISAFAGQGHGGAVFVFDSVAIFSFCTFVNNASQGGIGESSGGGAGGSIEAHTHYQASTLLFSNNVFVGSSDNAGNAISECDVSERTDTGVTAPQVFSLGGNAYDSSASCPFLAASDPVVTPQQIRLAPLGHYGGPTATAAPLSGSALIDAATGCLDASGGTITQDQRGVSRPQGMQCDIGAVESNGDLIFIDAFGG